MSNEFRPDDFEGYIGQENVIANLKIIIESAKLRNKNIDHILLHGPSGIGKTSLAYLISKVMKKKIIILNGTSLQKPSDIISPLTSIKENEFIFIDEIHSVSKEVMEVLYPVIEDNKMSIIIGKDYNSKVVNVKLPPFTIICATTQINKLPQPFLNRFPINFHLSKYKESEIAQIISKNSLKLNLKLNDQIALYMAGFTKLNPRISVNLLKRIYDYYLIENPIELNIEYLNDVLTKMNIYKFGLTNLDINYLNILKFRKIVGVESINQILDSTISTIINNIEPNLIKNNLIKKTFRGRELTEFGKEYLISIEQ